MGEVEILDSHPPPPSTTPGKNSLRDAAYARLRSDILGGVLPFGAVLSPRNLGREMGMSFLPVADALARLEADGLVETRDRVGTRVRIPTADDIHGVFIVREALESQAARLCSERATREQRRILRAAAREVDTQYAACNRTDRDPRLWTATNQLHTNFHRTIAEFTACARLRDEIERSQVLTFKIQIDNTLRRKKRPRNWHQVLATAITQHDPAAADEAARHHVRYGIVEYLEFVEQLSVQDRWRIS